MVVVEPGVKDYIKAVEAIEANKTVIDDQIIYFAFDYAVNTLSLFR